ncbi:MAG: extracellular solute-binding protein [Clostridia bacterium]|nr:extracellular solute-binding protein [Clostridia bacterium]
MKKIRILSLVMALLMLVAVFAACNKDNKDEGNKDNNGEKQKVTLTVWGSQEDQDMLKEMCAAYAAANPDKEYKFLFGVQGEGDAADKVLNDVTSGPDVFSFASDQINKLIAGGALAQIGGKAEETVKTNNTATSVESASVTIDGVSKLYAYPCTEDNTLFLYYDKSVLDAEDVTTLGGLLDAAHAAGKKVHFKLNDDGWYLSSFFFAFDDLAYNVTYDSALTEQKVDINYNNANGLAVMKALVQYVNHPALVIQTDDSKLIAGFTPTAEGVVEVAAGVSGIWNAKAVEAQLGDNMGVAKLPTVVIGGEEKQLTTYMGCKLIGVNGYSKNLGEAHKLAQWLTNEQNQLKRFETRGFGPSNKAAANNPAVQNDAVLAAVLAQAQFSRAQTSVPGNYWTPMGSLITPFIERKEAGTLLNYTDTELQELLDALVAQIAK